MSLIADPPAQPRLFPNGTSRTTTAINGVSFAAFYMGMGKTVAAIEGIVTAGTTGALRASLQGVSARTPNGSLLTSASATPSGNGLFSVNVTPYVETKGTPYAAVIDDVAAASDWTLCTANGTVSSCGFPYHNDGAGSVTSLPCIWPKYNDGSVPPWAVGLTALASDATWNNGSAPLYKGLLYTPLRDRRLIGVDLLWRAGASDNATFDFIVLDSGSNALQTIHIDTSKAWSANSLVCRGLWGLEPRTLSGGSAYRGVLKPTSANNLQGWSTYSFPNATMKKNVHGLAWSTHSNDGVTWTDSETDNFFNMALAFDQEQDVSGGSAHINIGGGVSV